jgi:hypothetical protein
MLIELMGHGIVVFNRLRKDAVLFDLPGAREPNRRGPNRKYGDHRLNLTKRAGQKKGWTSISFICRRQEVTHQYIIRPSSRRPNSHPA